MNISWYYIALGPNSIILIYCYCYHTCCVCCRRIKNKEENRAREYLYPDQKFCSGPNRHSCKTFLDCIIQSRPLQSTSKIVQSSSSVIISNPLLRGKTDLQIINSWLLMIWLILNSQYGGNENSHKSLDLLHGPQKTNWWSSNEPCGISDHSFNDTLWGCGHE